MNSLHNLRLAKIAFAAFVCGILISSELRADTTLAVTPGAEVDVYRGNRKIGTAPTLEACRAAIEADTDARKSGAVYGCDPVRDRITTQYVKPTMGPMPQIDPAKIPGPSQVGTRKILTRPAEAGAHGYEDGKFRNGCVYSHMNHDDSIVFPGQAGASHLHVYCGNTSSNAFSTVQSLADCASTSAGGAANCSSYWMPAMLMPDPTRPGFFIPQVPSGWNNYYATGFGYNPPEKLQSMPNGLVMVAGSSAMNTDPDAVPRGWSFSCGDVSSKTIPACPPGGELTVHAGFPNCWDGKHLDSADHRSHMGYPGEGGVCPASHPVPVVELSFHVAYRVPPGTDTTKWKLSCDLGRGGLCSHADVRVQWDTKIRDDWMDGCVRTRGSCQANTNKGYELVDVR